MPAVFCSHLDRPKPETQPLNTLLFEKRSHLFCLELAAKPSAGDELRLCLTTTPHRRRPIPARLGQVYRPLIFGTVDVRTRLHKASNSSEAQRSGVAVALPKPAQPEAHQQIHGRCRPGSEHREFWGMVSLPATNARTRSSLQTLCTRHSASWYSAPGPLAPRPHANIYHSQHLFSCASGRPADLQKSTIYLGQCPAENSKRVSALPEHRHPDVVSTPPGRACNPKSLQKPRGCCSGTRKMLRLKLIIITKSTVTGGEPRIFLP